MTNQEAITKLTNILNDDIYSWSPELLTAFNMAVDALKGADGDCISRRDAIEDAREAFKRNPTMAIRVMDLIKSMPSAQPSFPCCRENDHIADVSKMDCISRQAAIDAVQGLHSGENDYTDLYHDGYVDCAYDAEDVLKSLPSVQPELPIKKKCTICPHCDNCDVNDDGTIAQPTAQPQRWIPVTERLPEKEGWYITTVESEKTGKRRIEVDLFAIDIALLHGHTPNKFCKDGYRQRTVAWCEFPEPWKEGEADG